MRYFWKKSFKNCRSVGGGPKTPSVSGGLEFRGPDLYTVTTFDPSVLALKRFTIVEKDKMCPFLTLNYAVLSVWVQN